MATAGQELASLDFSNLIGGPLIAAITAQAMAAQSTADFIKSVGFYPPGTKASDGTTDIGNTPVYVDFKYPKEIAAYQPEVGNSNHPTALPPYNAGNSGFSLDSVDIDSTDRKKITRTSGNYTSWATVAVGQPVTSSTGSLVPSGTTIQSVDLTGPQPIIILSDALTGTNNTTITLNAGYVAATGISAYPDGLEAYVPPVPAVYQEMKFSVPILTILPIPFIKIDVITIDFNANITSTTTQDSTSDLSANMSASVKQKWPSGSAKMNAAVAYKKTTTSSAKVESSYAMAIHVQAGQDDPPPGMTKLLYILESAILSVPGNQDTNYTKQLAT